MEEWRCVDGYPLYEVSNTGRVRNVRTGKMLNGHDKRGYLVAALYNEGHKLQIGIHRLVAQAFLEPDPLRHFVNHKDGNKSNNNAENLEWVTASENQTHAIRVLGRKMGMSGKSHSENARNKLRDARLGTRLSDETKLRMSESAGKRGESHLSKKVRNVETGEIFDCITSAGEKYGGRRNISLCCNGKRKRSGGYHWEYVDTAD